MKNYKIVNLRALAIIFVVLGHSIILYKTGWNYYTTNVNCNFLTNLCLLIYLFHMPLFFSISGYLFIDKCQKKDMLSIVKNKFKRLIIPYIIIGILWVYPIKIISQYPKYLKNGFIYNIIMNIIIGKDNGHLWFLPALFTIFIISYLIEKYIKNSKIKFFLILLMFLLGHILNLSWFSEALKYTLWFYFGYFVKKQSFEYQIKYKNILIIFTLIFILAYFYTYNSNAYISLGFKYMVCLTIIPLMYNMISNKKIKIIENISNYSFGIYLFHSPLIYISFRYFSDINPLLMLLINFSFLGLIAYFLSYFFSNSKLKFIIGG